MLTVIVSVNGNPVDSLATFEQLTEESNLGAGIRLQVLRDELRRFVVIRKR